MASSLPDEITRLELLQAAHPDGLVFPHLADAYRRAGRFDQAENLLSAGLRRHSDYSSAHVVLGRLRLDQGKRQEAQEAFRRVLQLDPQNQVALEYLAEIAAEQGRLTDALSLFQRLNRVKTDDALAARVASLENRVSAAGVDIGGNGHAGVAAPPAGNGGARKAEQPASGSADQAAAAVPPAAASAAARTPPPEPAEVVTETMAELYARQGLHDRAAAVYRQLLERAPGDGRLRAKLDAAEAALRPHPRPVEVPDARPTIRAELRALLAWTPAEAPAVEDSGPEAPAPEAPALEAPAPEAPALGAPAPEAPAPEAPAPEAPSIAEWEPAPAAEAPTPGAFHEEIVDARVGDRDSESGDDAPPPTEEPLEEANEPEVHAELAADIPAAPAAAVRGTAVAVRRESTADPLAGASPQTRSLIALTDMLVGLLEYRDPFFRGSSSLTRLLATSVAEEMELPVEERVDLALAAVLRDLGRLALGGKLLPNPRSTPTSEARRRIERHIDLALHLMEGLELPKGVRRAVRYHHERWDGAGYPDSLSGDDIPVIARILAVVDSFAAMVSPRPYRLPRKVPEAAAELQEEAGTRYDPEVVSALVRVLARREQPHLGFVQRHHVLMVNPDHPGAVVTAAKLCSAGYLAEVAVDPATARERLRRVPVSALVVSAECGVEAVAALLRELRADPMFAALPIVVSDAVGVDLRVRLLESGADVCFPPGVRHAELQGTLGALVRRTLPPGGADGEGGGAESPWLALQGDIQDFPLTWLLQVMKYDSRTSAVGIRGARGEGVIYLQTGDAVHAQIRGGPSGEPALRAMLQWEQGRFTVQPDARPKERTITTSIMHLLLTQAVDEDHAAAGIFGAVSTDS